MLASKWDQGFPLHNYSFKTEVNIYLFILLFICYIHFPIAYCMPAIIGSFLLFVFLSSYLLSSFCFQEVSKSLYCGYERTRQGGKTQQKKSELNFPALPGFPHWLPWSTHPQPFGYEFLPGYLWNKRKKQFRLELLKLHRFVPGKVVTFKCSKNRSWKQRQWDSSSLHSPKGSSPNLKSLLAWCHLQTPLPAGKSWHYYKYFRNKRQPCVTSYFDHNWKNKKTKIFQLNKKAMTNYYLL